MNKKPLLALGAFCCALLCAFGLSACKSEKAENEWKFTLNDEGTSYTLTGAKKIPDSDVVIPSEYNGLPVTGIEANAIRHRTNITSITVPEGVTSIGDEAFAMCSSLTSITLPDSVTEIGEAAFYDCRMLSSITIPKGVTRIQRRTFHDCFSLTSVTIPDGVTEIGTGAFQKCNSLASITLPDGVTSIGEGAFGDCIALENISVPNSVTEIGGFAFYNCSALRYNEDANALYLGNADNPYLVFVEEKTASVTYFQMSESTKVIANNAFTNRIVLQRIFIPHNVTNIGDYAFYGCSSLTQILYHGTEEEWNAIAKGENWDTQTGDFTVEFVRVG